ACPAGKEPEVTLRGERREQTRQLCVSLLLSPRGPLVDLPRGRVHGRHGVVAGLDLDISLRDLLRVVEGMAVEKCPQKLTRYVLDGELEMGMLERRVVAGAVDRAGQSVAPVGTRGSLVLGDDAFRGVTGPGGRHDVLEGTLERMDEPDARSRRCEGEGPIRSRKGGHRFDSDYASVYPQRGWSSGLISSAVLATSSWVSAALAG